VARNRFLKIDVHERSGAWINTKAGFKPGLVLLFIGLCCGFVFGGLVAFEKPGAAFTACKGEFEPVCMEGSRYANEGGLKLGRGCPVTGAGYEFFFPPETGTLELTRVAVVVEGTGTITRLKIGGLEFEKVTDSWRMDFNADDIPHLLTEVGDEIGARVLAISLEVESGIFWAHSYDVRRIRVEYECRGGLQVALENFHVFYNAYKAVSRFKSGAFRAIWQNASIGESLFYQALIEAYSLMSGPSVASEAPYLSFLSCLKWLEDFQSYVERYLAEPLAQLMFWFACFWEDKRSDIESSLGRLEGALLGLCRAWLSGVDGISEEEAEQIRQKTREAASAIAAFEEDIDDIMPTILDIYNGRNRQCDDEESKHYAGVLILSLAPLFEYELQGGGKSGNLVELREWLEEHSEPQASRRRYAIIVGIDQYDPTYGPRNLPVCVNDANGFRSALLSDRKRWSAERMWLFVDSQASSNAVRSRIEAVAREARPGDIVVYFQSGHGGQVSGRDTYLCMYDRDYYDYEFAADIAKFQPGVSIIVFLDVCHAAGMFLKENQVSGWRFADRVMRYLADRNKFKADGKGPEVGWIVSCGFDELSFCGDRYSLFTGCLLEGFEFGDADGDRLVTFLELFEYARPCVIEKNNKQRPEMYNGDLLDRTVAAGGRAVSREPSVTNGRVVPSTGSDSTEFEFMVDYYDPDGDPPKPGFALVIISGTSAEMRLKTGSPANGTYHYKTALGPGKYWFHFIFLNTTGEVVVTSPQAGPLVAGTTVVRVCAEVEGGPVTNSIGVTVSFGPSLQRLEKISWNGSELCQTVEIPPNYELHFSAEEKCGNYEFVKWVFKDDAGNVLRESNSPGYGFGVLGGNLYATAYFRYKPKIFSVEGLVSFEDGRPFGGVGVQLESPVQRMTAQTGADGRFVFSGVKGGVPVAITASAGGYYISPPTLSIQNLCSDETGLRLVAVHADFAAPSVRFVELPGRVRTTSSVTFSWVGSDDVSSPGALLYSYKLDGLDADWSPWVSETRVSYQLRNGAYRFHLRVKDEAGNVNQAPLTYDFVVNAAPAVASASRTEAGIWTSRVRLEMPVAAPEAGRRFVLLPGHSGIPQSGLVPVALHRPGNQVPEGVNEFLSGRLNLPALIKKGAVGWEIELPSPMEPGESAEYHIRWGKIIYFGWQEEVPVSRGLPNLFLGQPDNHLRPPFIDDRFTIWRLATRDKKLGSAWAGGYSWVTMNASGAGGILIPERPLRFVAWKAWDGSTAEKFDAGTGRILSGGQNVIYLWQEELSKKQKVGGETVYEDRMRYSIRVFSKDGTEINRFDSEFSKETSFDFPTEVIRDRIWICAHSYREDGSESLWFVQHDLSANLLTPTPVVFETLPRGQGNLNLCYAKALGLNVALLFEHHWDTPEGDERGVLKFQIRHRQGMVVKETTVLAGDLLPDSAEQDDFYQYESCTSDKSQRLWISFTRDQGSRGKKYFSCILEPSGVFSISPIQGERYYWFCDKDNFVWAWEPGSIVVLDPGGREVARFQKSSKFNVYPTHEVGGLAVCVSRSGGYRIYDRWSPGKLIVDVPPGVRPTFMEFYDLDLWEVGLHPKAVAAEAGGSRFWSYEGVFSGTASADVSGVLKEGLNTVIITQEAIEGGQLLVTFPYSGNNPPFEPASPNPADSSVDVALNTRLVWAGGDPDEGDSVVYEVYYGECDGEGPALVATVNAPEYDPGPLEPCTSYCWGVVAVDSRGERTAGPIWTFSTSCPPAIEVGPRKVDFGSVRVGDSIDRFLTVTNRGRGDLVVSALRLDPSGSADFSLLSGEGPFTIPSGGSLEVSLRYTPSVPATAAGFLEIESNDPENPTITVTLEGRGVEGIPFIRGDCNQDGMLNISDPLFLLYSMFGGGEIPSCLEAADSNGDCRITIADPIWTLYFLFAGGAAPAQPFPQCGYPEVQCLGCEASYCLGR